MSDTAHLINSRVTGLPLKIGIALAEDPNYPFVEPVLQSINACSMANLVFHEIVDRHASSAATLFEQDNFVNICLKWIDNQLRAKEIKRLKRSCDSLLEHLSEDAGAALDKESGFCRFAPETDLDLIICLGRNLPRQLLHPSNPPVWCFVTSTTNDAHIDTANIVGSVSAASLITLVEYRNDTEPPQKIASTALKMFEGLSGYKKSSAQGQAAKDLLIWALWRAQASGIAERQSPDTETNNSIQPVRESSLTTLTTAVKGRLRRLNKHSNRSAERPWQIGLRPKAAALPWTHPWPNFTWIDAPSGHYYADPFLHETKEGQWLFAEDYIESKQKGVITCAPVSDMGDVGEFKTVIEQPYHLSFPLVFNHENNIYMVPESAAGNSVDLFVAEQWPDTWRKVQTLWEGAGLDTVPYQDDDGTWFFFTSVVPGGSLQTQLLLFTADTLFDSWRLHPANPISLDIRYSRNAGRILNLNRPGENSMRVRISQDGAGAYGGKASFHEIIRLNKYEYQEKLIGHRHPPEGFYGSHHYDRSTLFEVADIK